MANRKAKSAKRKPNSLGGEIIVGLENAIRYAKGSKAGTLEHRVEVHDRRYAGTRRRPAEGHELRHRRSDGRTFPAGSTEMTRPASSIGPILPL